MHRLADKELLATRSFDSESVTTGVAPEHGAPRPERFCKETRQRCDAGSHIESEGLCAVDAFHRDFAIDLFCLVIDTASIACH